MPEESQTTAAPVPAINPLCNADHPADVLAQVSMVLCVLKAADQGAEEAIASDEDKRLYADGRWVLWRTLEGALEYARQLIAARDRGAQS